MEINLDQKKFLEKIKAEGVWMPCNIWHEEHIFIPTEDLKDKKHFEARDMDGIRILQRHYPGIDLKNLLHKPYAFKYTNLTPEEHGRLMEMRIPQQDNDGD